MIKSIKTRTILREEKITVGEECTCDSCKRIIYRKQNCVFTEPSLLLDDYIKRIGDYHEANPSSITFYKVSENGKLFPDTYCQNCVIKEVKNSLNSWDRLNIEKIQTECYYSDFLDEEVKNVKE